MRRSWSELGACRCRTLAILAIAVLLFGVVTAGIVRWIDHESRRRATEMELSRIDRALAREAYEEAAGEIERVVTENRFETPLLSLLARARTVGRGAKKAEFFADMGELALESARVRTDSLRAVAALAALHAGRVERAASHARELSADQYPALFASVRLHGGAVEPLEGEDLPAVLSRLKRHGKAGDFEQAYEATGRAEFLGNALLLRLEGGERREAARIVHRALQEIPREALGEGILFVALRSALEHRDAERARQLLSELPEEKRIAPEGLLAASDLAVLDRDEGQVVALAQELVDVAPDESYVPFLNLALASERGEDGVAGESSLSEFAGRWFELNELHGLWGENEHGETEVQGNRIVGGAPEALITQAVERHPEETKPILLLARRYEEGGEAEEAQRLLERWLERREEASEVVAQARRLELRTRRGEAEWWALLDRFPRSEEIAGYLGGRLWARADWDGVQRMASRSQNPSVRAVYRAALEARHSRYAEGRRVLDTAIEEQSLPGYRLLFARAVLAMRDDEPERALEELEDVYAQAYAEEASSGELARIQEGRAEAAYAQDAYEDAAAFARAALEWDSTRRRARSLLRALEAEAGL